MYKKVKKEKKEKINLEEAIAEIRDSFGEGAIMKLSDVRKVDVDVIPTGSL
ncbi:MAG: DNA recombination/repair protein RecA, partial [Candidatus Pacebacteria bacterium]|nr:DNA recombination/repair protein RecA [Candidatus Paceibacterota bacterium]